MDTFTHEADGSLTIVSNRNGMREIGRHARFVQTYALTRGRIVDQYAVTNGSGAHVDWYVAR
jgi:hypothetical protein